VVNVLCCLAVAREPHAVFLDAHHRVPFDALWPAYILVSSTQFDRITMQGTAYPAYPYNTPYPAPGQYYPPQAFPNAYANGSGREPTTNIYADWPKTSHPQNGVQNSMPRPRQERAQMPRPQQLATGYRPQLKSAMKRPARSVSDPSGQLQRMRTNSDPRRTLNPMTRTRTNSNAAKDIPGLFHLCKSPACHQWLIRFSSRSLVCVITRGRSSSNTKCQFAPCQ
jgi:hypothetical protein